MEAKNVKNIIVVDDDRSIRVVISTALTRAGYNVKSSGTAAGMWRLVESDFADVLITDVGLPDGDALDILPKLQKNNQFVREYMDLIGHREFGISSIPFVYPNGSKNWYKSLDNMKIIYWIKQWVETYSWILDINSKKIDNIKLVCYESLCKDSKNYQKICSLLNIESTGLEFRLGKFSNLSKLNEVPNSILEEAKYIYQELVKIAI